jgi:hypothetical protein
MTNLLRLLSLYYHCEVAAENARLNFDQLMTCTQVYQNVKAAFLTEENRLILAMTRPDDRAPILMAGASAFEDWENANPDVVLALRDDAKIAVLGTLS